MTTAAMLKESQRGERASRRATPKVTVSAVRRIVTRLAYVEEAYFNRRIDGAEAIESMVELNNQLIMLLDRAEMEVKFNV